MISSAPFPLFDASRLRRLQKKKKKKESLQSRPVHSEISDTNRFSKCTNHTEELSPSSSSAGGGTQGAARHFLQCTVSRLLSVSLARILNDGRLAYKNNVPPPWGVSALPRAGRRIPDQFIKKTLLHKQAPSHWRTAMSSGRPSLTLIVALIQTWRNKIP